MKQENKDFLEQHMNVWTTLRDAFFVQGITSAITARFGEIMKEEFIPNYSPDLWCSSCIADMIRDLYQRYERYKLESANAIPTKVKASFPKNTQNGNKKS